MKKSDPGIPPSDAPELQDDDTAELPQLDITDIADADHPLAVEPEPAEGKVERAADSIREIEDEIDRLRNRWKEVDDALAQSELKVAALEEQLAEKSERLEQAEAELRAAAASVARSADDASKAFEEKTRALQVRVQDLENYIEGRRAHWQEQNEKIRAYEETVDELSLVIDNKTEQLARQETEKRALGDKLAEVEKSLAQFIGRQQGREESFQEFKRSLQEQIAAAERTKQELAARERELEQARAGAATSAALTLEHEAALARRDSEIAELKATLSDQDQRSREANSETTKHREEVEELRRQLDQSAAERAELTTRLQETEERIDSFRRKVERKQARAERFESQVEAMRSHINSLQAELQQKQSIIEAFQRSAHRLNDLNRLMRPGSTPKGGEPPRPDRSLVIEAAHLFEDERSKTRTAIGRERKSPVPDDVRGMIVVTRGDQTSIHPLTKDRMTIGRSFDCDICIVDTTISRHHADVTIGKSGLEIEDAGSTNGILFRHARVDRAVLRHGDAVQLAGQLELRYLEVGPDEEYDAT